MGREFTTQSTIGRNCQYWHSMAKNTEFLYTFLMSPNPKSTFIPPPNPSAPGTPEWTYNEIMREIEPDLMTNVLPAHEKMYAAETSENRLERMKAYDKAFALFDTVSAECEHEFHREITALHKEARTKAMKTDSKENTKKLQAIEKEMDESA